MYCVFFTEAKLRRGCIIKVAKSTTVAAEVVPVTWVVINCNSRVNPSSLMSSYAIVEWMKSLWITPWLPL